MTTDVVALESVVLKKAGMTRVFDESGNHVPVTVLQIIPNFISQVKTSEKDGYEAYQVVYGEKRASLLSKPVSGKLEKSGISTKLSKAREVRVEKADGSLLGKSVSLGLFKAESVVDATSFSKGQGTQGVIKRYGFSGGPATHGSHFHRRPGSIGCRATPARVFKGKKMPGRHGGKKCTMQNLSVFEINQEKGYVLVKGSVAGSKGSFVILTLSK